MIIGSQAIGVSSVENNDQASVTNRTGDTAHIAAIIDYPPPAEENLLLYGP
ncbi:hypothetical protein [Sodalis sp.]|uniref:hypothetical protein n=1 Tax=Sodalis sp. (in: enterobacteria) TaxID=1898979 RepID=UPI003872FF67